MTEFADQSTTTVEHGGLQRFAMDEPIDVRFDSYRNADELARLCRRLSKQIFHWRTQGSRWRGSCEAPDDGYFHYLPA